jgi:hypothetical protein
MAGCRSWHAKSLGIRYYAGSALRTNKELKSVSDTLLAIVVFIAMQTAYGLRTSIWLHMPWTEPQVSRLLIHAQYLQLVHARFHPHLAQTPHSLIII